MSRNDKTKRKGRADKGDVFDDEPLSNKLGSSLRQMYDDVVNEPVPDDFMNLLKKADDKKSKK